MTHSFVFLLFELSLVLGAAKIGGLIAQKIRQPVVLGELMAGIILGNLTYLGIEFFEGIRHDRSLATLAELGIKRGSRRFILGPVSGRAGKFRFAIGTALGSWGLFNFSDQ